EIRAERAARVAAAADDARPLGRRSADADRLSRAVVVLAERAVAERAGVEPPERRRVHDAEHCAVLVDQRDVHGELAVSLQELFRPVERVYEPVAFPAPPLGELLRARLL